MQLRGAPRAQQERSSQLSPLAHLTGSSTKVVTVSIEQLRAGFQAPKGGTGKALAAKVKPQEPCYPDPEVFTPTGWDQTSETLSALLEEDPPCTSVSAPDLLGCWVDSYGNTVLVQSTNGQLTDLTATLSRSPRPDIHLSLWQLPDGSGWYCGQAKLDVDKSSRDSVAWTFPDGRRSVWAWQAFTLEALQLRGLELPEKYSLAPGECMQVCVPAFLAY